MLRMKIQDGGRRDERCGFKYVSTGEKIRLHFWTQWNIASNFIVSKVRGFFQWCFVQEKGRTRTAHLDGRFFMQTIRIIPSVPYHSYSRIVDKKTRPLESASKRDERLISLTEQDSRQKWIKLGGKNDWGSILTTSARETTRVHQTVLTRKRRKLKRNDCASCHAQLTTVEHEC